MAEPIRVLHVLGSLNAGGAESRTMDIYRNIDRSKIQFDFAIHTDEHCFFTDEVLSLGARIFTLPRFKGINYFEYKKAWEELFKKNKNLKIVHGHMTTTAFIYLKIAKQFGIKKRIAHARNSNKENVVKKILSKFAHVYATNLLAVSKEAAVSEFGKKRTYYKVEVIPNAIDIERFKFKEGQRKLIRDKLGINSSDKIIIHVGRFHKQKNHLFILKIFKELVSYNQNLKLILIGEGREKKHISKFIEHNNLNEKVYFFGVQPDVENYLCASDLFIFPSIYEGFPGALLEAQINGLPCIAAENITNEIFISTDAFPLDIDSSKEWIKLAQKLLLKSFSRIIEENLYSKYDVKRVFNFYQDFYS